MTETTDTLTIINRALARIGAGAISAVDEDTDLCRQVMAVHDDLVDAAFGIWHWSWPRRLRALEKLAAAPAGWSSAFAFPAEAIGNPKSLLTDPSQPELPLRRYALDGRSVAANADALWGVFTLRIASSDWPPLFRAAFTLWLAAELCVPVTHDATLAAALLKTAVGSPEEGFRGGLMGRAIAMDHAGGGNAAPLGATDVLTSAHLGAGSWDGGIGGW